MKESAKIRKLSKDLYSLEKERDKYHMELLADISNADATQKFSDTSDKIDTLREDIRLVKEHLEQ